MKGRDTDIRSVMSPGITELRADLNVVPGELGDSDMLQAYPSFESESGISGT